MWLKKLLQTKIGYFLKWLVVKLLDMDMQLATPKEALDRARTCTECFEKGKCIYCGCNFEGMIVSRKPCERYQIVKDAAKPN